MTQSRDPRLKVWDRPADRLRQAAEDHYAAVRANNDLTPDAKQRSIAKKYLDTKQQLDAMNTANPTRKAADLAAAKRAAFGIDDLMGNSTPAEKAAMAMSFRDAQQRASQLTSDQEAQQLLDTANQSGDVLLARAVGNYALTTFSGFGLSGTAQNYLDANPAQAAAVQRVVDLQQMPDFATLSEFVTPVPPEMNGLSSDQLAAIQR